MINLQKLEWDMQLMCNSKLKKKYLLFCIVSIFWFATDNLYAQESDTLQAEIHPALHVSFDDIVVTATRTQLPAWRSPVPISLITHADLDRRGGLNIADILERSEPMTMRRYGAGASLATTSVRGIAADQTVILLNGIQINSPQNGLVDLSTIPVSGIERIEIARGGASSLYGNHAMGGVVNIITRSAGYNRPVVDLQVGGGSYGLRRMNVQSQIATSSFDLSFGLGRDQSDGDFTFSDPLDDNQRLTRENADYVQSFAMLDGRINIDDETTIRLFTRFSHTDRGLPGPYFGQQADDRQEDEHIHSGLVVSRVLTDDVVLEFRPFYMYSDIYYISPEWNMESRSINRQYGATFDINTQLSHQLLITFGGELSDASVDANDLSGDVERVNSVAYLSGDVRLPKLGSVQTSIFPSVRYDRFSNNHAEGDRRLYEEITWKVGTTVQPFTYEQFLVRASVGKNFKAPGLNDMYWVPGGNEDLVPERSISYDSGIRWNVPIDRGLLVDAGFFSIRTDDRIIWQPGVENPQIWSPVNVRKVHADGFELDIRWKSDSVPVRFGTSYTYQDVRQFIHDDETGTEVTNQLPFVPFHLLSGEIGFDVRDMRISVYPRYNGKRYADEANATSIDSHFTLDLRSDYTIQLGTLSAIVSLDIKNIFDADYQIVQHFPMPGRNYELNVRLRY